MAGLHVDSGSATPVYHQVVQQVRFLIESGGLREGERLPSARLLAANLGVNRNTVAKAYGQLRDLGLIETRGAAGTVVTAAGSATSDLAARDEARALLAGPVREARALGLSAEEVGHLALNLALQAGAADVRVVFAECNEERATSFAADIAARLGVAVEPCLIADLDAGARECDLLVTTFFHLAEVRRWVRGAGLGVETVAVVVGPHVQTLVTVAGLSPAARVGVRYTTDHQREQVRDWLAEAGPAAVVEVPREGPVPADLDLLVVPQEHPELAAGAAAGTRVIEFGGVLDQGSVHTLEEVLGDLRRRVGVTG